jgi:hypothetical protein
MSMAKLTKQQAADHRRACDLVASSKKLDDEERWFVLQHWRESADAGSPLDGAFFTPLDLAFDLSLDVDGDRVIDLCAGTGRLAFACRERGRTLVCVERSSAYAEVGRRVVPEADWIVADVTDLDTSGLGTFSCAIANPPYNHTPRVGSGPRYTGGLTHYHVIDVAADLARRGVFLVPRSSAPFITSGRPDTIEQQTPEYRRFVAETGIELGMCIGLDTTYVEQDWHGVSPAIEAVNADFRCRRPTRRDSGQQLTRRPARQATDTSQIAMFSL